MLCEEEIQFTINNIEVTCEVRFNFTKGYPAYVSGLPENCYPAEPNMYDLYNVKVFYQDVWWDAPYLVDAYEEEIIQALEEQLT